VRGLLRDDVGHVLVRSSPIKSNQRNSTNGWFLEECGCAFVRLTQDRLPRDGAEHEVQTRPPPFFCPREIASPRPRHVSQRRWLGMMHGSVQVASRISRHVSREEQTPSVVRAEVLHVSTPRPPPIRSEARKKSASPGQRAPFPCDRYLIHARYINRPCFVGTHSTSPSGWTVSTYAR
jgi:hypothetical protein